MGMFPKLSDKELRDLVKNKLIEILRSVYEGKLTWAEFYYRVKAEQSLSEEEKREIFRNPTEATIRRVFGEEVIEYEVEGLRFTPPAIIVTPSLFKARSIVEKHPFVVPMTDRELPEITAVTVYKALSLMVKRYPELKDKGYKIVIVGNYGVKPYHAMKALVFMCRVGGIEIVSKKTFVLPTEYNTIIDSRVLSVADEVLEILDWNIMEDFQPAVKEFAYRYDLVDKFKEININVEKFSWREDWWNYGFKKSNFKEDLYRKLLEEGFREAVARKIASYNIKEFKDFLKMMRDIKYYYKDEKYFKEHVIPKLSKMFNYRPDLVEYLV